MYATPMQPKQPDDNGGRVPVTTALSGQLATLQAARLLADKAARTDGATLQASAKAGWRLCTPHGTLTMRPATEPHRAGLVSVLLCTGRGRKHYTYCTGAHAYNVGLALLAADTGHAVALMAP